MNADGPGAAAARRSANLAGSASRPTSSRNVRRTSALATTAVAATRRQIGLFRRCIHKRRRALGFARVRAGPEDGLSRAGRAFIQASKECADYFERVRMAGAVSTYTAPCIAGRSTRSFCPCLERIGRCNIAGRPDGKPEQTVQATSTVVHMAEGLVPPQADTQFDFRRLPVPPEKAHKMIILKGTIQDDGTPSDLHVYESILPEMDEAARTALSHWKFKPAMREGKPVAVQILVGIPIDGVPPQVTQITIGDISCRIVRSRSLSFQLHGCPKHLKIVNEVKHVARNAQRFCSHPLGKESLLHDST